MSEMRFYNVWRTRTPADRAHLIATMKEKAGMFASKPGFVSLIVSECAEDGRVVAEGIWESREAFDNAVSNNPEAHSSREQMEAFGVPEPGLFVEAFRIEPDSNSSLDALRSQAARRWASRGFETRIAGVNGVELFVAQAGEGDLLFLLHGYPQSGEVWRDIAPTLAKTHTVVVPDLRGMGLSQVAAGGYDLSTVAEDMHQLAVSMGHQRVKLAGHDWGAAVSAVYALLYRQEVTKLVFIESALAGCGFETLWNFATPNPALSFIPFLLMGDGNTGMDVTAQLLRGNEEAFLRHLWATFTGDREAAPFESWAPYIAAMARPGLATSSASYYRSAYDTASRVRALVARKLDIPVLAIAGEKGIGGHHRSLVEAFALKLFDNAVLEGGGHFIPEERPRQALSAIIPYLA
jgi:pimeloyl-ACP methyl ester carboxylesterase/heme-degrading monooxygenase HmoA